jgi:TolA-binding protein
MDEEWEEAAKALDEFIGAYPKSPWADDARFWKCYILEENDHPRATVFKCYQDFLAAFPSSEWADTPGRG